MKRLVILFSLVVSTLVFATNRQPVGTVAALWTYDDAIDAETFLYSQDFQKQQVQILFSDETVRKWIEDQNKILKIEGRAIMVKAYGCGAHASGGNNVCEVAFVIYDSKADPDSIQPIFARLIANVNVTKKTVTKTSFIWK